MKGISFSELILGHSRAQDFVNMAKPGVLLGADVYNPSAGKFIKKTLFFNNGKLLSKDQFERIASRCSDINVYDAENKYVTSAILDQHIHGGYGVDFNKATESQIRDFLQKIKKWGHSDILATLVPDTIERLNSQMDILRKIINNPDRSATKILGINLEGPFFSPAKAGIHPPKILLKPSVENLKKLNLEDVRMITIAPELDEGYKATEYLNSLGIVTSAGHSSASAKQVRDSGVTQVTHLFNAMSGFHHRIPTIANEGLLNDNIYAEMNSALELLDPKTMDLIMKVKPKDKLVLISDALSGANIKEDFFIMGGKRINIDENGIAKDKDGILAGSIKYMAQVAKQLIDVTKMSFEDFIRFSSLNPAKNLGVEADYKLNVGNRPNLIIWDKETLLPEQTVIKGI